MGRYYLPDEPSKDSQMIKKSFLIDIHEELREGAYWTVTSKRLPGLFLGGIELGVLRDDLPDVIRMLFRANYQVEVEVTMLVDGPELHDGADTFFAAMPLAA
jgi:hypothetical protein